MSTDGSKRCVDVAIGLELCLRLFWVFDVVDVDGDEAGVLFERIVLAVAEGA
jgi:hypothetical protein